jgi:HK97 family phage portal protein
MGIRGLFRRKGEKRYTLNEILAQLTGGNTSASGVAVSNDTALSYNPWFAGVNLIADSMAMLPLPIYSTTDMGRSKLREHAAYPLLNYESNSYQSAYQLKHFITLCAAHWGNGYANIERDAMGNPVAIWPVHPNNVQSISFQTFDIDNRQVPILVYDIKIGETVKRVLADDMLHIYGLSTDGVQGVNPVKLFQDAIGAGVACERYAGTYFANGSKPSGALKIAGKLSPEDAKYIRQQWEQTYGGLSNSHRIALLQEGAEYVPIANTNEDSQFLETRRFSVEDVARVLRIKPHMLGDLTKSSYASIEAQNLEYVQLTLMPWIKRWESEVNRKLVQSGEHRIGIYAECDTNALLRGDTESRYAAYAIGRQWGWLSINDIRQRENLSKIKGGDTYMQPLNMQDTDKPAGADKPTEQPQEAPDKPQRAIDPALRGLLADVCGRIARREAGAVSKAVERGDDLQAVYAELRQFAATLLAPAVPQEQLDKLLDGYCQHSTSQNGVIVEGLRTQELLASVLSAMGETDSE